MPVEPGFHRGMVVGAIVVQHKVSGRLAGKLVIQTAKESHKLLMPVSRVALADNLALQHVERREERRCPVALIVMRHRAAAALFQGQARLRAVQRLNLALLVDTEHQRVLRRIEIEPEVDPDFRTSS